MHKNQASEISLPRLAGSLIAASFGSPEPPDHLQHAQSEGGLSLSELRLERASPEPSLSMGYRESFHVAVLLRDVDHELWLNGRSVPVERARAGETFIVDQRQDPRALIRGPSHFIHFSVPLAAMNRIAAEIGSQSVSELQHNFPAGWDDPVMRSLAECARAALSGRHAASRLLLDGILVSACAHVIGRYGRPSGQFSTPPTRLAPWQERRAKELMAARLDISLAELAQECGISSAHFGRAFRNATGVSPHRWLIAIRIDKAEQLLLDAAIPLAQIALDCGFSNQSHFSIAFKARNHVSPGRWRREHLKSPSTAVPIDLIARRDDDAGWPSEMPSL